MIDLGPHAIFIVWAYAGVLLAVIALIAWVIIDRRAVESRIARLEARRASKSSTGAKP